MKAIDPLEATVRAAGIILMTRVEPKSILLLRHHDRWDLPKGHVDGRETDQECALREFEEETGIERTSIRLHDNFRFELNYEPTLRSGKRVQKRLLIYLATIEDRVPIQLTEHNGYEWVEWSPPHQIQELTIDPLLAQLDTHLRSR